METDYHLGTGIVVIALHTALEVGAVGSLTVVCNVATPVIGIDIGVVPANGRALDYGIVLVAFGNRRSFHMNFFYFL